MVTYLFPPLDCGVGRQIKFVKYLPLYGWTPIVLAAKNSFIRPIYNPNRIVEIPRSTKIYRTFSIEIVPFQMWLPTILKKLLGINPKWFQLVDAFLGWVPFALRAGLKILREEKVDLLFSTSLPNTCHLVALLLKRKFGVPWVADFRDAWTQNPYITYPKPILKIEEKLERAVIENADKIVTITDIIANGFITKYPDQPKNKFLVLPHGSDPDDFKTINVPGKEFTLVYVGSIYGKRTDVTNVFLDAVKELLDENSCLEKDLRISFVGNAQIVRNGIRFRNLEKVARVMPYVSHREAIKYMMTAQALLLITGARSTTSKNDNKVFDEMSGKIVEYIVTGRPILTLAEENSSVAKIVKATGTGIVIDPMDKRSIMEGILYFYGLYKKNQLTIEPNLVELKKYDVRRVTRQLSDIFEDVIKT
jgi:hypothetical protein